MAILIWEDKMPGATRATAASTPALPHCLQPCMEAKSAVPGTAVTKAGVVALLEGQFWKLFRRPSQEPTLQPFQRFLGT